MKLKDTIFSSRQIEVLKLLAAGKTNREIAAALFVCDETIKTHFKAIFKLLGAKNRVEALRLAREKGFDADAEVESTP